MDPGMKSRPSAWVFTILTAVLGLGVLSSVRKAMAEKVDATVASSPEPAVLQSDDDFLDGIQWDGASLGGILFPHFHAFGAFGGTTGEQAALAVNDHDPQREATLQSLEPGLSLRAGMLQGYVNGTGITDSEGEFTFTLEEGFLKSEDKDFAAHAFDRSRKSIHEYYINHGNQANMQAAYLFNYSGKPGNITYCPNA